MGRSIKFDEGHVDASGVWDRSHQKTQAEINQTTIFEAACQYTNQQKTIKFCKTGNAVKVFVDGLVNIPTGSTALCTVPDGCYPSNSQYLNAKGSTDVVLMANSTPVKFRFNFSNNKLNVYNYGAIFTDNNLYLSFVYML